MFDALGNLGDFIGGIAVVATLVYLALQIRQNTNSVQGASAASYLSGLNAFNSLLAQDGAVADIWHNGLEDPESLNPTEFRQFEHLINMVLSHLEQSEELEGAGSLSSELALSRDFTIEFMVAQPGFHTIYTKWGGALNPRLHSRIKDAIRRQSDLSDDEATPPAAPQETEADSA